MVLIFLGVLIVFTVSSFEFSTSQTALNPLIVTDILSRTVSELSQLIVQISHQRGHFDSKFQVEGVTPPTNHFCTDS